MHGSGARGQIFFIDLNLATVIIFFAVDVGAVFIIIFLCTVGIETHH